MIVLKSQATNQNLEKELKELRQGMGGILASIKSGLSLADGTCRWEYR